MKDQGFKDDANKARWSLLPIAGLAHIVNVLEFGAKKYGARSWRKVTNGRERYFEAYVRHTMAVTRAFQDEGAVGLWSIDEESGLPHIAHAACNLLFVLALGRPTTAADKAPPRPRAVAAEEFQLLTSHEALQPPTGFVWRHGGDHIRLVAADISTDPPTVGIAVARCYPDGRFRWLAALHDRKCSHSNLDQAASLYDAMHSVCTTARTVSEIDSGQSSSSDAGEDAVELEPREFEPGRQVHVRCIVSPGNLSNERCVMICAHDGGVMSMFVHQTYCTEYRVAATLLDEDQTWCLLEIASAHGPVVVKVGRDLVYGKSDQ